MKRRILLAGLFLPLGILYAQVPITNSPGVATNGNSSNQYWSRAGNTPINGLNNVFGTLYNTPIWLQTNGVNRVQFFSNQGTAAPAWVNPLPYGGGMGINLDPSNPIRNPLSLLHIGEELQTGTQGGYRPWMQVGTFMGHRSDQFYVGTKPEASPANDRTDAVINWGDNTNLVGGPSEYGPDYLRFIFTAPRGASGYNIYAAANDGLEIMRLQPDGSVGIGNFYNDVLFPYQSPARRLEILSNKTLAGANGTPIIRMTHTQQNPAAPGTTGKYIDFEPRATGDLVIQSFDNTQTTTAARNFKERYVGINTSNPGNTMEINSQLAGPNTLNGATPASTGLSGLRFTDLNSTSVKQPNPGTGFLGLNASGDVVYVDAPVPGGTFGASCTDPSPTAGALTFDTKVNLNNFNLYFTNSGTLGRNRVGIGYPCATALNAKFNVIQKEPAPTSANTISGHFDNTDGATAALQKFIGVQGYARGVQVHDRVDLIGGQFTAYNARYNTGVFGRAESGTWTPAIAPSINVGGDFQAYNANAYGVRALAIGTKTSVGVNAFAGGSPSNMGGSFTANVIGSGISYGVYASGGISGSTANSIRAGYFAGIVEGTMMPIWGSDQQFKTNVTNLSGTLEILSSLLPRQYYFDTVGYERFNFGSGLQYGFIAQEIEAQYPNLVHSSVLPAEYDSLGVEIAPAVSYKSLNYTAIIPLNTQAIIELNKKVDAVTLSDESIKTNVQDLTGSLEKVLDMRGISYDWNQTVHPELNLDSANHVGFIAQEIQQIDPRLTFFTSDSLLHVEYDKVVPILAEAIQELNGQVESKDSIISVLITENNDQQTTIDAQQTTIDDLNDRLSRLENCLSGILPLLCQLSHSAIQANTQEAQEEVRKNLTVTLSNRSAIVLDQNVPNPFAEQTVINFSIPETVKKAQIHFYDGNGRFMNSVEVTDRGLGSVTVFGSDLSTGVYTYTLVADGQVVATKKMMKQ